MVKTLENLQYQAWRTHINFTKKYLTKYPTALEPDRVAYLEALGERMVARWIRRLGKLRKAQRTA